MCNNNNNHFHITVLRSERGTIFMKDLHYQDRNGVTSTKQNKKQKTA